MPTQHGFLTQDDRAARRTRLLHDYTTVDRAVQEVLAEYLTASGLSQTYRVRADRDLLAWGVVDIASADAEISEADLTIDLILAGAPPQPWLDVLIFEKAAPVPENAAHLRLALRHATKLPVRLGVPHAVQAFLERRDWDPRD